MNTIVLAVLGLVGGYIAYELFFKQFFDKRGNEFTNRLNNDPAFQKQFQQNIVDVQQGRQSFGQAVQKMRGQLNSR